MPRTGLRGALLLVCLAVALAGCSSGATGQTATAKFRDAANKVCATYLSEAAALPRPAKSADLNAYLASLTGVLSQELGALKQIDPPPSVGKGYVQMTVDLSTVIADLNAAAAAGEGHTAKAGTLVSTANTAQADLERLAGELDLASCKAGF